MNGKTLIAASVAAFALGSTTAPMAPASGSAAQACEVRSSAEVWTGVGRTYTDDQGQLWHRVLKVVATSTTCGGTQVRGQSWHWKLHKPADVQGHADGCVKREKGWAVLQAPPVKTDPDGTTHRRTARAHGVSRRCGDSWITGIWIEPWAWHAFPPGSTP